jgi:hypothetical protein
MNLTAESIDNLTLLITEEIHVNASLETTFAAILEEIGPQSRTPEGQSMNMKIEPWPGGRWYRDLGQRQRSPLGDTFKPSSARLCWNSPALCLCPTR